MSKEARNASSGRLLNRLSWILATVIVIVIIVIFRQFGSDSAQGQTSPRRVARGGTSDTRSKTVNAPNGVVAVVNGQQITRDQLAFECMRRFGPDVLSGLITTYLVRQECTLKGVQISEAQVDAEIERVAASFGLTAAHWIALLENERNTPEAKYRREMIWPQLALQALTFDTIQVTNQDMKRAFDTVYGPRIKTRVIVTKDREKAERLLKLVKQDPGTFGDVAKDQSDDSDSASARGLIPPIGRNMGSPEIENAAFALKPGQISGIVQVANRFYILKCESIIGQKFVSSKELPQVQKQLRERVRSQKINNVAVDFAFQLEKRATIVRVYDDAELSRKFPQTAALINGRAITIAQLSQECFDRHAHEVLEGEINRTVLRQALTQRRLKVTQADLDEEIRKAAETYGFIKQNQANVDAWLKQVETKYASVDVYIRDAVWPSVALKSLVSDKVEISEQELQKAFEANYGPRVRVLAIVLKQHRKAQDVWEQANGNRTERFFGELAATYSIEPTSRANFGQVAPIRRHGGSKAIEDEAFRLRPGEISALIGTGETYILLYCLGRTDPIVDDINDVRAELTEDLYERTLRIKMGTEINRLLAAAKTRTYLPGRKVIKKDTLRKS